MILFQSPSSPYARKVIMVLHETGQLDDVELVFATGTPADSSKMPTAHNPLGKLPTLVDGERVIVDSRVICRFFNDRAGAGLYGDAAGTWDIQTVEAIADGMLDAALLMRYETVMRPEEARSVDWTEGQWQKIARAASHLQARYMDVLGGPLNAAQIATACALAYLDFRHADRDWRGGNAVLADWFATFGQRPSFQATIPVG